MIFVHSINLQQPHASRAWSTGVFAGLAGGCIEIAWIVLYAHLAGREAAGVARGITGSLFPAFAAAPLAVPLGIAIHMALAVILGIAIAVLLRSMFPRLCGSAREPFIVTGMLAVVWVINFFVVLPVLNPAFVSLVPYGASLASKLLFGLAAAFIFQLYTKPSTAIEENKDTGGINLFPFVPF